MTSHNILAKLMCRLRQSLRLNPGAFTVCAEGLIVTHAVMIADVLRSGQRDELDAAVALRALLGSLYVVDATPGAGFIIIDSDALGILPRGVADWSAYPARELANQIVKRKAGGRS